MHGILSKYNIAVMFECFQGVLIGSLDAERRLTSRKASRLIVVQNSIPTIVVENSHNDFFSCFFLYAAVL